MATRSEVTFAARDGVALAGTLHVAGAPTAAVLLEIFRMANNAGLRRFDSG